MMPLEQRKFVMVLGAGLVAAAGCSPEDAPRPSAGEKDADTVERARAAPRETAAAEAPVARAGGDSAGLTQRTGLPFEPVRSTRDTLPLLLIMRNLERNMVAVQAGIWRGDHEVVREAARAMADHARIPGREIEMIRSALGEDGLKGFVAADQYWHEQATELANAARDGDMDRIVPLTAELLQRCASCHTEYRQPLRESPEW